MGALAGGAETPVIVRILAAAHIAGWLPLSPHRAKCSPRCVSWNTLGFQAIIPLVTLGKLRQRPCRHLPGQRWGWDHDTGCLVPKSRPAAPRRRERQQFPDASPVSPPPPTACTSHSAEVAEATASTPAGSDEIQGEQTSREKKPCSLALSSRVFPRPRWLQATKPPSHPQQNTSHGTWDEAKVSTQLPPGHL